MDQSPQISFSLSLSLSHETEDELHVLCCTTYNNIRPDSLRRDGLGVVFLTSG